MLMIFFYYRSFSEELVFCSIKKQRGGGSHQLRHRDFLPKVFSPFLFILPRNFASERKAQQIKTANNAVWRMKYTTEKEWRKYSSSVWKKRKLFGLNGDSNINFVMKLGENVLSFIFRNGGLWIKKNQIIYILTVGMN